MQNQNTVLPPILALSQEILYAYQKDIFAIDAKNGEMQNKYSIDTIASCTVAQEALYIYVISNSHRMIQAIQINDGTILWSHDIDGTPSNPVMVTAETVYIATNRGTLYALGATDGKLCWRYNYGGIDPVLFPSLAVAEEMLLFSFKVNPPYAQSLIAFSTKDGTQLWQLHLSSTISFPTTVVDNIIYISCNDGSYLAFHISDGSLLWQRHFNGKPCSSPIVVNGIVYSAFATERVTLLQALSANDGSPVWTRFTKLPAGIGYSTRLTVDVRKVYIGATDGSLLAHSADDGTLQWSYQTGGLMLSQPVVAGNTVYIGANDGYVYALRADNGSFLWQTFVGTALSQRLEVGIQGEI